MNFCKCLLTLFSLGTFYSYVNKQAENSRIPKLRLHVSDTDRLTDISQPQNILAPTIGSFSVLLITWINMRMSKKDKENT